MVIYEPVLQVGWSPKGADAAPASVLERRKGLPGLQASPLAGQIISWEPISPGRTFLSFLQNQNHRRITGCFGFEGTLKTISF